MDLCVRGHPLHSRSLSVTLLQREDGRLDVFGEVLDLRKRGFVPVAGDLQPSGIVHQMQLRAVVAPESARLESLAAAQPAVAFEPSALTQGESCRDPIGRIQALVGAPLDRGFAKRWLTEIGGPLGCSHILTLGQLLASTVAWALERDRACPQTARRPGERVFRRDLVIDGYAVPDGDLELSLQLTDLHLAPSPELARPIERLATARAARAARWGDAGMTWRDRGAERRARGGARGCGWRDHGAALTPLVGQRLASGVGGALVRRFGDASELRPLLDLLLNLTPAAHQCMAAFSENWPVLAMQNPSQIGMGGIPDSCFMWRRGGALDRAREEERRGGTPPLLPS